MINHERHDLAMNPPVQEPILSRLVDEHNATLHEQPGVLDS
jgi:hypothetical protein